MKLSKNDLASAKFDQLNLNEWRLWFFKVWFEIWTLIFLKLFEPEKVLSIELLFDCNWQLAEWRHEDDVSVQFDDDQIFWPVSGSVFGENDHETSLHPSWSPYFFQTIR